MLTPHLDHDVACVGADMFAIRERCVIALAAVLLLAGCSKEPGKPQQSSQEQPQAAEQKASPAPAPPQPGSPPTRPEQTAAGEPKDKGTNASTATTPEPPRSAERPAPSTAPTAGSAGSSPPSQQAAPEPPAGAPDTTRRVPDVVILKGAPMGGVRFAHKLHTDGRHINCAVCHHASKPEKPQTIPQQACTTCHLRSPVPPMKTKLQAAFHDPSASSGLCMDCHKQENVKGRAAPVKCLQCHKKENAQAITLPSRSSGTRPRV